MNVTRERWLLELRRKSIHLLTGFIPLSYALFFSRWQAAAILAILVVVVCAVEYVRRCKGAVGEFCCRSLACMLRDEERSGARLMGATPYCAASLVCVLLFPKPIAVLSLLYLSVGDTAASLIGLGWGRHRVNIAFFGQKSGRKSWEGSAAFAVVCAAIALFAHFLSPDYPLAGALAAAPAAGLAEALLPDFDDNWTVPLTAASTMVLALLIGID